MTDMPDEDSGHFDAAYSLKTNDQTRDHYRSWAETYDKEVAEVNGYAQPQRVADMLDKLRSEKDCRILDAGCGSGLSGEALKAAGFSSIDGCDFSPEMLEKSLEKGCYAKLFEADLNATIPDTPNAAYDVVTCVGVFSFGHVYPDACDELLRVLKPGGHMLIALNEPYWDKGDLAAKLDQLTDNGAIEVLEKEYGDHLPGHDVMGWVISMVKK
ncbi:MAG: class I SAM-dependent methyltransferase [Rhizobiaceae bacterium]